MKWSVHYRKVGKRDYEEFIPIVSDVNGHVVWRGDAMISWFIARTEAMRMAGIKQEERDALLVRLGAVK